MAVEQKWTFKQLGGARRTLELSGWAAPFGRPRHSTIVTDGLELRESTRRYAGNDEPTVNVFGVAYRPWDMTGRWMDEDGGVGFAKAKRAEVALFLKEAQLVEITWGDTRSVIGILKKLYADWEAVEHIAWKLTWNILRDPKLGEVTPVEAPKAASGYTNRLIEAFSDILNPEKFEPNMKGSFLDSLDSLVAAMNAPGIALGQLSDQIGNLRYAVISDIRRFRAGIAQFKQALFNIRVFLESTPGIVALEAEQADQELELSSLQSVFGETMAEALKELAAAESEADKAERTRIKAFYEARQGDTFEKIAVREYGSSAKLKDILEANDLPAGAVPVPGVTYILPK